MNYCIYVSLHFTYQQSELIEIHKTLYAYLLRRLGKLYTLENTCTVERCAAGEIACAMRRTRWYNLLVELY